MGWVGRWMRREGGGGVGGGVTRGGGGGAVLRVNVVRAIEGALGVGMRRGARVVVRCWMVVRTGWEWS